MRPINSAIITNAEFSYYAKLCNGGTEDIKREGIQAIIRQRCAEGRMFLNSQIDYLKGALPKWICSPSAKVRMWSLWLSSIVNDENIESVSLQAIKGERDPQFIAPVLSIVASRHEKRDFEKIALGLENRSINAELNTTILDASSMLFSQEQFYRGDREILKKMLSDSALVKWAALWIPIFYAYPPLVKQRGMEDFVKNDIVNELFQIGNPRISEYAMWSLCLHGTTKAVDLPMKLYDYKTLDSNVLKWFLQVVLADNSVQKNIAFIQELLAEASNFSTDVKEGLLRGLDEVAYHPELSANIARWYLMESSSQIKRLLLMRMIRLAAEDVNHEETYYEVISDEFYRGGEEREIIRDCLSMWRDKKFLISDGKLIPLFERKVKQYAGYAGIEAYHNPLEVSNWRLVREGSAMNKRKKYDVFISHAVRDKNDYVDSLYNTIKNLGINIFYDSAVISWGDKWKDIILQGTESSEFAVIVISANFFGREWTERELHEFLGQQNESGQKIILPLLHGISRADLKAHYPVLDDIQCISSADYTEEAITILLAKELIKRYR